MLIFSYKFVILWLSITPFTPTSHGPYRIAIGNRVRFETSDVFGIPRKSDHTRSHVIPTYMLHSTLSCRWPLSRRAACLARGNMCVLVWILVGRKNKILHILMDANRKYKHRRLFGDKYKMPVIYFYF